MNIYTHIVDHLEFGEQNCYLEISNKINIMTYLCFILRADQHMNHIFVDIGKYTVRVFAHMHGSVYTHVCMHSKA